MISPLNSFPISLTCSRCEHLLLEAFVALETKPSEIIEVIVEKVDLMCSKCQAVLKEAIDDLSRLQKESEM